MNSLQVLASFLTVFALYELEAELRGGEPGKQKG